MTIRTAWATAAMVAGGLASSGCARPDKPVPAAPPVAGAGTCDAHAVAAAIGTTPTAALVDGWRTGSRSRAVRILRPGTIATMDYREDRLNVHLDAEGRVIRLRCG